MTRYYKIELNNGIIFNMPRDKARSKYEYIRDYGIGAVLERAKRAQVYTLARAESDVHIRAVICPNGARITQF